MSHSMRLLALVLSALISIGSASAALLSTQTLHVATRTELAAQKVTPLTAGDVAVVAETGHTTTFRWDSADRSTDISAQGGQIGDGFVAPDIDPDGSSGAWVAVPPTAALTTSTATGDIAATTVQSALAEIASEKAPLASPTFTGDPSAPTAGGADNDTSLATTAWVQTFAAGLTAGTDNFKTQVVVATATSGTLASSFENGDTVNGVVLATGDRILIKDQASATENGLYTVNASGAPTRSTDADSGAELEGAMVPAIGGSVNPNSLWRQSTAGPITLGSTNLVFIFFPQAGAYSAGTGLCLVGNVFCADLSDQATAEAGSNNTKVMTPLRVAQAITAQVDSATDTWTGAKKLTATTDANVRPPLQVIKHGSPLSYDAPAQNAPVAVFQWSDSTALPSNGIRDSVAFLSQVTGDGSVTLAPSSSSGGTSASIWRGVESSMNKTGDGSAHAFTGQATLNATGAVGYSEAAMFVGTCRNDGAIIGSCHGSELVASDGLGTSVRTGTAQSGSTSTTIKLDAGASAVDDTYNTKGVHITGGTGSGQWKMISDYVGATKVATVSVAWSVTPDNTSTFEILDARDTQLIGFLSRVSRDFGGTKEAINYKPTSEGTQAATAIMSPSNGGSWSRGIDFEDATFTSSDAMRLEEGQRIRWSDGTNNSYAYADTSGNYQIAPANNQVQAGARGTVGVPFYSFNGDANTGLYSPAADQVSLTAGGTEGIRIDNSTSNFPVYIRVNGVLSQVTVGAVSSCGAGFRCLRVPN